VIAKRQRCSSGSALATINCDEIRALSSYGHSCREFVPEFTLTNSRFNTNRKSSGLGENFNKVNKARNVTEGRMRRWALAVSPNRDSPDCRNFWRDLFAWKQAPESRLCPLAQLDFNRPNWRGLCLCDRLFQIKRTVIVSAAEVSGSNLPNQIGAMQMVNRHAAFAGGVQCAGNLTAPIERLDSGTT
jgi:hypothetical protein